MESTRLLQNLLVLRQALQGRNISALVEAVGAAIDSMQADPSGEGPRQMLTTALDKLRDLCEPQSPIEASESFRRTAQHAGLAAYQPEAIQHSVEALLSESPLVTSQVRQRINELRAGIKSAIVTIDSVADALEAVGVSTPDRLGNRCEVELHLPEEVFKSDLNELNEELKHWIRLFKALQEVSAGKTDQLPITGMSEGSLDVYVSLDPEGAKALLIVLAAVWYGLKERVRHKEARERLEEQEMPQEAIDIIAEKEKVIIENTFEQKAAEILQRFEGQYQENRANELKTSLKNGMRHLAESLQVGSSVDVVPPQIDYEDESSEGEEEEVEESLGEGAIAEIRQLRSELRALESQVARGSLRTLELPPPPPKASGSAEVGADVDSDGK